MRRLIMLVVLVLFASNVYAAPIDSPQAVRFCNEKVRPAAEKLAQAYVFAKQVLDEWTAHGGVTFVPNTSDTVSDSASVDGRPVITGANVNNVINRLSELVTDYEADTSAKLNTILQVAVR